MFAAFIPLRHIRRPNFAATGYKFHCNEMKIIVRQLRRCRVGEEIEMVPTAWLRRGEDEPMTLAMLVDVGGNLVQFHEQCAKFKITLASAGTKDKPQDLLEVAAARGMMPTGTTCEGEPVDCFGRPLGHELNHAGQ